MLVALADKPYALIMKSWYYVFDTEKVKNYDKLSYAALKSQCIQMPTQKVFELNVLGVVYKYVFKYTRYEQLYEKPDPNIKGDFLTTHVNKIEKPFQMQEAVAFKINLNWLKYLSYIESIEILSIYAKPNVEKTYYADSGTLTRIGQNIFFQVFDLTNSNLEIYFILNLLCIACNLSGVDMLDWLSYRNIAIRLNCIQIKIVLKPEIKTIFLKGFMLNKFPELKEIK